MEVKDMMSIMQSDYKLWERSETEENDDTITKTIDIPWGVGEFSLTFEGIKDAKTRRGAVEIWGTEVRRAIDDQISDEAVTARAAQRLAATSADADRSDGSVGGDPAGSGGVSPQEAVPSYGQNIDAIGNDPIARLNGLREGIRQAEDFIASASRELKALEAYEEIMNASEISPETAGSDEGSVS